MDRSLFTLLFIMAALNACSLAPDFVPPDQKLPEHFKEIQEEKPQGEWKPAVSREKETRGEWWKIFSDSTLDALEKTAVENNALLTAIAARLDQSRALVRANASTLFPTIELGANAVRAKSADASTSGFNTGPRPELKPYTLYSAGVTASYEVDWVRRVRDNEAALSLDADAQETMYHTALLSLQADVAQHYFMLQSIDAQRALLKETVAMRSEAQRIMQKRYDIGIVSGIDLGRTQSELSEAEATLTALDRERAVLENALAVLLGVNPSGYQFEYTPLEDAKPPYVPAGIPSTVLERRPDVAAASAAMQAANLRIGVARTAFFPVLNLTASGGFESTSLSDLFKWSSRSWALGQTAGSALVMTVFDSGRNAARVDAAHAAYAEAVANYRQQVLVAMGEVENALSSQRLLVEQSRAQESSAAATKRTLNLMQKRYDAGDVNYFEVVDAGRAMLAANTAAIDTRASRLIATVNLIRALGGGWEEEVQPVVPEIKPASP